MGTFDYGIFISLFSEGTVDDFIGTIEEQARDITGDYGDINTKYKELYPFIRIIRIKREYQSPYYANGTSRWNFRNHYLKYEKKV